MFVLPLIIIGVFFAVEITRRINNPSERSAVVESIKFQPEWSRIHSCDGSC